MADLDNLLDDIEIEHEESDSPNIPVVNVEEELQAPAFQDWQRVVEAIPEDIRKRWSSILVNDAHIALGPLLQHSDSYRSWDGQSPNHQSAPKLLQEAVRNACTKCAFDEKKTVALMALANPQNEAVTAQTLQTAYSKQILKDLKRLILSDPNYDENKFSRLAHFYKE
jgi:hypothetical protein